MKILAIILLSIPSMVKLLLRSEQKPQVPSESHLMVLRKGKKSTIPLIYIKAAK